MAFSTHLKAPVHCTLPQSISEHTAHTIAPLHRQRKTSQYHTDYATISQTAPTAPKPPIPRSDKTTPSNPPSRTGVHAHAGEHACRPSGFVAMNGDTDGSHTADN